MGDVAENLMRLTKKEISGHNAGWKIQNELTDLISIKKMKEEIKSHV
jgi:hypothetical protein